MRALCQCRAQSLRLDSDYLPIMRPSRATSLVCMPLPLSSDCVRSTAICSSRPKAGVHVLLGKLARRKDDHPVLCDFSGVHARGPVWSGPAPGVYAGLRLPDSGGVDSEVGRGQAQGRWPAVRDEVILEQERVMARLLRENSASSCGPGQAPSE